MKTIIAGWNLTQIAQVLAAAALFGLLMAVRQDLTDIWARSAVAGLAFAILAGAIMFARRDRSTGSR